VLPKPQLRTAGVSVFVRTGSVHESRANYGISHVLEHMAFKGIRASPTGHEFNLRRRGAAKQPFTNDS
jgi:predicted Zn-dependent peptidase